MSWSKGSFDLFEISQRNSSMLDFFRKHLRSEDEENLMTKLKEIIKVDRANFQVITQIKTAKKNIRWMK